MGMPHETEEPASWINEHDELLKAFCASWHEAKSGKIILSKGLRSTVHHFFSSFSLEARSSLYQLDIFINGLLFGISRLFVFDESERKMERMRWEVVSGL